MNPDTIRGYCDTIDAATQAIRDELLMPTPPDPADATLVSDADDLQLALSAGGDVLLAPALACACPGGYRCDAPETSLLGQGENLLVADTAPALDVPVGVDGLDLGPFTIAVTHYSTALRIGRNDDHQVTVDDAPRGITLRGIYAERPSGQACVRDQRRGRGADCLRGA